MQTLLFYTFNLFVTIVSLIAKQYIAKCVIIIIFIIYVKLYCIKYVVRKDVISAIYRQNNFKRKQI